jgi:hypothetical protein
VRLNRQQLKFGECPINDNRDQILWFENTHTSHPIDITFSKVPQFLIKPDKLTVPPMFRKEVVVTFCPKNVGQVNKMLEVLLIQQKYKLKLPLIA